MKYLVDTNVLSEVRRARGIEKARRKDPRFAASLEKWLSLIVSYYRERIFTIDIDVAEEWGRLSAPNPIAIIDGLLAATAKVHGMTLVTRNVSDVARTGVASLNPWLT